MLRSRNHLAVAGCRIGRGTLLSRAQSISTRDAQHMIARGQLVGLPSAAGFTRRTSAHFSATPAVPRGSLAAMHGGHHRNAPRVSVLSRGCLGSSEGRRSGMRGPGSGNVDLSMALRGIQTGPFSGPFSPGSKPSPKPSKSSEKPTLINRYIAPPEDGLTRYPTFRSPQGVLRGMDYMGTAVFALSGTVTAGQVGMDLLGCVVVGTITATGGGTVRDLLLGNTPVSWMHETEYLWICLLTSISVFFLWSYLAEKGVRDDMAVLNWADAMGIGAFCCIGAQAGVRKGLSKIVCVACGMLTSTFGGVIRDVLCSRPPRILFSHAEIYASTAVLGSTVYIFSRAAGLPPVGRIACGFATAAGLRVLAFTTDIRLPTWSQPSSAAIENITGEPLKKDAKDQQNAS